jgi:hypothetical protein
MIVLMKVLARTDMSELIIQPLGEVEFLSPQHQKAALETVPAIAERVANIEPFIPARRTLDHG